MSWLCTEHKYHSITASHPRGEITMRENIQQSDKLFCEHWLTLAGASRLKQLGIFLAGHMDSTQCVACHLGNINNCIVWLFPILADFLSVSII